MPLLQSKASPVSVEPIGTGEDSWSYGTNWTDSECIISMDDFKRSGETGYVTVGFTLSFAEGGMYTHDSGRSKYDASDIIVYHIYDDANPCAIYSTIPEGTNYRTIWDLSEYFSGNVIKANAPEQYQKALAGEGTFFLDAIVVTTNTYSGFSQPDDYSYRGVSESSVGSLSGAYYCYAGHNPWVGNSSLYQIKENDHFVIPFQLMPIIPEEPITHEELKKDLIHIGSSYEQGKGGSASSSWLPTDFTSTTGETTLPPAAYAPAVLGTYNYDPTGRFHVGDGTIESRIAKDGIPSSEKIQNGVVTPAWVGDVGITKVTEKKQFTTLLKYNYWKREIVDYEIVSKGVDEHGKKEYEEIPIWEWVEYHNRIFYYTNLSAEYYKIKNTEILDAATMTVTNNCYDSPALYTFTTTDWSQFNIYKAKGGNIQWPLIVPYREYHAGSKSTGPDKIYQKLNDSNDNACDDSRLKFQEADEMGANRMCEKQYTGIDDHVEVDGEIYLGDTLYKYGVADATTYDGKWAGWKLENPNDHTTNAFIVSKGPNIKLLDMVKTNGSFFFTPKQIKGINYEQEKLIPNERLNGSYYTGLSALFNPTTVGVEGNSASPKTYNKYDTITNAKEKGALKPAILNGIKNLIVTFVSAENGINEPFGYPNRSNEPVLVHTPVIDSVKIINPEQDTQLIEYSDAEGKYTQNYKNYNSCSYDVNGNELRLDCEYKINFSKVPHKDAPGYLSNSDIFPDEKYVKEKYVTFPFAVRYEGTYYNPKEKISLGRTCKEFTFYIPTWALEGVYGVYNAGKGSADMNSAIKLEVVAINGDSGDAEEILKNEHITEKHKGSATPTYDNESESTYVATYYIACQVSGWIYNFQAVGSNDADAYASVPVDSIADTYYAFCPEKIEKKVGQYNRLGEKIVRATKDGVLDTNWNPRNTLPFRAGTGNTLTDQGENYPGCRFAFNFKTITNLYDEDDYIYIKPTFRYYKPNDSTGYDTWNASSKYKIYYHQDGQYFIEYGSKEDTNLKRTCSFNNIMFEDAFYNYVTEINARADRDKNRYAKNAVNTAKLNSTAQYTLNVRHNPESLHEFLTKKNPCATLSEIYIDKDLRLFTGAEEELRKNSRKAPNS